MSVFKFFRRPGLSAAERKRFEASAAAAGVALGTLETEHCFTLQLNAGEQGELSEREQSVIRWLLSETFEPEGFASESFLVRSGVD